RLVQILLAQQRVLAAPVGQWREAVDDQHAAGTDAVEAVAAAVHGDAVDFGCLADAVGAAEIYAAAERARRQRRLDVAGKPHERLTAGGIELGALLGVALRGQRATERAVHGRGQQPEDDDREQQLEQREAALVSLRSGRVRGG